MIFQSDSRDVIRVPINWSIYSFHSITCHFHVMFSTNYMRIDFMNWTTTTISSDCLEKSMRDHVTSTLIIY